MKEEMEQEIDLIEIFYYLRAKIGWLILRDRRTARRKYDAFPYYTEVYCGIKDLYGVRIERKRAESVGSESRYLSFRGLCGVDQAAPGI